MRPPRHQRRENAKRAACCLPARRLWNLDLPPPTSHHNVRPRVPGMTTPASLLLLLPVAFSAPDPLHRLQRSPARPLALLPQLHNPAIISTFPASPNPRFPHRLKLFFATTEHLDLHALHHLHTAASTHHRPAQPLLNLYLLPVTSSPLLLSQILISSSSSITSLTLPLTPHLPSAPPLEPLLLTT